MAFFSFLSETEKGWRGSLPRRHPDILDLRRLVQKLMTFALLAIHPIARQAYPPRRGREKL